MSDIFFFVFIDSLPSVTDVTPLFFFFKKRLKEGMVITIEPGTCIAMSLVCVFASPDILTLPYHPFILIKAYTYRPILNSLSTFMASACA